MGPLHTYTLASPEEVQPQATGGGAYLTRRKRYMAYILSCFALLVLT